MEPLKLVKYALDSTVSLVNKGEEPTAALHKTAKELDLNPNYIQRVGEALNVALHLNHFKTAEDKSQNFPVADIQQVTKDIFGAKEASDAQKQASWFHTVDEDIDYNKLLTNPQFKKTASEIRKAKISLANPTSFKGQYKKAVEYISRLEREITDMRVKQAETKIYIEALFNHISEGFKKSAAARTAFHEFESQAYSEFGDRADGYVDLIYKAAGLKEDRGTKDAHYISYDRCPEIDKLDVLLKVANDHNSIKRELEDAELYVAASKAQFKEANYKLNPDYKQEDQSGCNELADKIAEVLEKEAGPITKSVVDKLISGFAENFGKTKNKSQPVFKNTDQDNKERVTMLQELIMTDPILAHQDPKKILAAYQQVLRLAPHLAKEKEVVRAILRQMTATQALGPMEANQYIEANTNMLKQHELLHKTQDSGDKKK